MTLHNDIINIDTPDNIDYIVEMAIDNNGMLGLFHIVLNSLSKRHQAHLRDMLELAYLTGHRDARHSAAEFVLFHKK